MLALTLFGMPVLAASPTAPGINNFRKVDERVYRGAQPTDEGFKYLASIGVKVVIDLREQGQRSRAEEKVVTKAGMRYISIPMMGLIPPSQAQTTRILELMENPQTGPVFVHCMRGADRTGAVIAAYRIDHQKWDNSKALKEAMSNGMRSYLFPLHRYIRNYKPRVQETVRSAASSTTTDAQELKPAAADAR